MLEREEVDDSRETPVREWLVKVGEVNEQNT